MDFKVEPFRQGSPRAFFRGSSGSTSGMLARLDLLDLLDEDTGETLMGMSDARGEDVVVLVNHYLRLALANQLSKHE